MNALKDLDERKFILNTPLLLDQITFEGPRLVRILALKLEDWDLEDIERFPHLVTDTFVTHVLYQDSGVTAVVD